MQDSLALVAMTVIIAICIRSQLSLSSIVAANCSLHANTCHTIPHRHVCIFCLCSLYFIQLCNASEAAGSFNRNQPSQQELSAQCKIVLDHIPELISAMREAGRHPESAQATKLLIESSKAILMPAGKMCTAAKAAVPTIGDKAAQLSVSNSTRQLAMALSELRNAALAAEEVISSARFTPANFPFQFNLVVYKKSTVISRNKRRL